MRSFNKNQYAMAARSNRGRLPRRLILLILASAIVALGILLPILMNWTDNSDQPVQPSGRYQQSLLTPDSQDAGPQLTPAYSHGDTPLPDTLPPPTPNLIDDPIADPPAWRSERIKPGDSFATIMKRLGYAPSVVAEVMNSGPHAEQLKHLKPNHQLQWLDQGEKLEKIRYNINRTTRLDIDLTTDLPSAQTIDLPVEVRFQHTSGEINSSLYLAGKAAGLADALTMELANIFGWDIDFTLDLRKGDHFIVIYSELFLDGKKIDNGKIFAAELTANGRKFRAVRYENEAGEADYYAPSGASMRKAFSRNPLPITRVTSRFNPNRLHPIFKTRRPHRGVDYGAASGTPVRSTGDGKVIFRGKKGGYGNTVIIQHGQRYTTLYAHLKNFARSVKLGSWVKQGKTIAYVGQSGWATGPHLHYEFRENGVHKNPLTVKLPPAKPVAKKEQQRFAASTETYLKQLDQLATQQLATRSP